MSKIYCGGEWGGGVGSWKIWRLDGDGHPILTKEAESISYESEIKTILEDEIYLYIGGGYNKKIWKVRKSDLVKVAESDSFPYSNYTMAQDSNNIYVSGIDFLTGQLPTIWKIQKSDMAKVGENNTWLSEYVYAEGIHALAVDETHLYAGGTKDVIWKISTSNMAKVAESSAYGISVQSLAEEGDYVYVGRYISSYSDEEKTYYTCKVGKLQKSNLSQVAESGDYEGFIRSITTDSNYIYFGGAEWNTIWKVQISNMSKVAESTNFPGQIWKIINNNDSVFGSGDSTTGYYRVYKKDKADLSSVAQSDDYGGIIYGLSCYAEEIASLENIKAEKIRSSARIRLYGEITEIV